jgi:hypothetical protein
MTTANNNKGNFWSVVLISCIPMILGSVITASISKSTALNEITTIAAVMNEKINGNKELLLNLIAESEKRRTEQYQYLCGETQEIKEQLKQKKNISMLDNDLYICPEMEYLVKRSGLKSKWLDTLTLYNNINDSLYMELCVNLRDIAVKIKN